MTVPAGCKVNIVQQFLRRAANDLFTSQVLKMQTRSSKWSAYVECLGVAEGAAVVRQRMKNLGVTLRALAFV